MANEYLIKSEEELKKKLDIKNWNQLSKQKFMDYLSLMPNTDPEVIKMSIEKFPEFAQMTKDTFVEIRDIGTKQIDSGDRSYVKFVDSCNSVISMIQKKMDNDNLTTRQQEMYMKELHELLILLDKKESEHKNFLLKAGGMVITGAFGLVVVAATVLGVGVDYIKDKVNL